ncbi:MULTISPECIES: hypothetical protein [Nostocales]|nr:MULTISPECIES: hypothetical protein [Nostocales]
MSESGCPGLKDEQDETRAFFTNYQLPITHYQPQRDNQVVRQN